MQFKHPEILYALFLLIIPIIVHLFQLRRFQKVAFTNVKMLKELELQTRKSSKLKKFLILCCRLLMLAGLIFAFAQPFFSKVKKDTKQNTFIYLDNSFSMQAKGKNGELLKRAVQDIIKNNTSEPINLLTNNTFLKNLSVKDLKNELLNIEYSSTQEDFNTILFKIKNSIKKNKTNSLNELFLISDFQNFKKFENDSILDYNFIQLSPVKNQNIAIDSIYISDKNNEKITLKVKVTSHNSDAENIVVSLFKETILQGKSTVSLLKDTSKEIDFVITNNQNFNGKVTINSSDVLFDNELFFSINNSKKLNVLAIGSNNKFLSKIYTNDEFNFTESTVKQLDYSLIKQQDLVIVNELENLSSSLINTLTEYVKNSGNLVLIPNLKNDNSLNFLLQKLNLGSFLPKIDQKLSVTDINFSHPLLKNTFEKRVKNFQYPTVNSYYNLNLQGFAPILKFQNEQNFISYKNISNGSVALFSAAINKENSNFKKSPLIVPIFYNFAKNTRKIEQLFYTIGTKNNIKIDKKLDQDAILNVKGNETDFIPLQKISNSSVELTFDELPQKSGFYSIKNNNETLKNTSFNYSRIESKLPNQSIEQLLPKAENIHYFTGVNQAFETIQNNTKSTNLWKYFLLASILFLLVEIALLKFLKS